MMMTVQEAARALDAEWCGEDAFFTGVSTDSRMVGCGDLFVALKGEKFDGHEFVAVAKKKGAVAAMVCQGSETGNQESGISLILVKDTRLGLGQLAVYWRGHFTVPLVAVTGSNGKTTVKEMIASILRQTAGSADRVLATEGNLNNDIGVPQMLLRLRAQHAYAVIEMGMNHAGEIAYLTGLAKPSVALITNAGTAHLEGLGSVEAVARAKGEVFEGLDQMGVAIINADDPYAPLWRKLAGSRRVVDFGLGAGATVSACYQLNLLNSTMTLTLPDGVEEVELQVPGEHNVRNALAAAAATAAMGIGKKTIALGLSRFSGVKGRMQKKRGLHEAMVIDDSYNANPESVRAALAVLAAFPGKKILVLGDMGELGGNAVALHELIGEEARLAGVDRLLAVGELSAHTVAKFGAGARHFERIEELLAEVRTQLAADATVLVKGSRFMQMERVVKEIEL
jgi:UDP-N-acetylmuramoyl-tripeptide--D-alanyl-D-alanine ligase